MSWSDFYVTTATAAATVLGLLFVAVQFNLERLPAGQPAPWLATARATWIIFATLFFVALIYLTPAFTANGRIVGTTLVVLISGRRTVSAWLPLRHATSGSLWETLKGAVWVMLAPLALYALLLLYTIAASRHGGSQGGVAYVIVGMFALALRNSWDLLVELHVAIDTGPGPSDDH
jgi:hypothetical protein